MEKTTTSITRHNRIQYFIDGDNIFPQIMELIDSAKESVYVEVFLFYDDESGMAMVNKLAEKAKAGLDVRVLLSEKGTEFNKSYKIYDTLKENGVKVLPTFPLPKVIKDIWEIIDWVQTDSKDKKTFAYEFQVKEPVNIKLAEKSREIMNKLYKRYEKGKTRKEGSFFLKRKRKKIFRSLKYYDHRKIILVDNKKAFLGGMNFGNDYLFQGKPSELGYFHDIGILVEGDVVKEVLKLYLQIWHLFSTETTTLTWAEGMRAFGKSLGVEITTLSSFPRHMPNDIRQAYLREIKQAEKYIYIINLYLTDSELIQELINARQRGVDVHLISTFLPTRLIESWFSRILYKGYFYLIYYRANLRDKGVKLHHYTRYNVHAKVGLVDDRWVTIGSSNLDYSSLRNAMEINVSLKERSFIESLKKELFLKDFENSEFLDKKLSFFKKIYYYICYLVYIISEKYFI